MADKSTQSPMILDSIYEQVMIASVSFPRYLLKTDEMTQKLGMPFSYLLIIFLSASRKLTIGKIAERMNISKPNIAPIIRRLVEQGYMERMPMDKDKRKYYLKITAKGEEICNNIHQYAVDRLGTAFSTLSSAELNRFLKALLTVNRVMENVKSLTSGE